ncbi:MAG: hypothetical protein GDA52_05885 [Rhodobacteraceae bacterium]|nr:hypothetical protein [Paracoccaceae bacterium]
MKRHPAKSDRPTPGQRPGQSRKDRLKSALKANLWRRKAQAQARRAADTGKTTGE